MKVIVKPRQGGKTQDLLELAQETFSYIVCPTTMHVQNLWARAREQELNIPQPITWDEFVNRRYRGGGIPIEAVSLTGGGRD